MGAFLRMLARITSSRRFEEVRRRKRPGLPDTLPSKTLCPTAQESVYRWGLELLDKFKCANALNNMAEKRN